MNTINPLEISYIEHPPQPPRKPIICSHYDENKAEWTSYAQDRNGEIFAFKFNELVNGHYITKGNPARKSDIFLLFSNVFHQHFSVGDILEIKETIIDDLTNGLSLFQSYFIYLDFANQNKEAHISSSVRSLIEYALLNHRAFYDRLNLITIEMMKFCVKSKSTLPDSFRKVAQKSEADLKNRHQFTSALINFYKSKLVLFSSLRGVRDAITHHGKSPESIYVFNDGFGVSTDHGMFSKLSSHQIWRLELCKPNQVGSILSFFVFLFNDMLTALNDLTDCFIKSFQTLPPAVSPSYKMFWRNELSHHYHSIDSYCQSPWRNSINIQD